ncbi:MAG: glucosaminidase domain-containing protein [Saprospiraceae bacterium]|nr:glucosaminidase domain-containing protein [Saprospiraceae bacterium]
MGKTKWYGEEDAIPPRMSRPAGTRNKNYKPIQIKGSARQNIRLQPWWLRLQRSWLALRFQAHRYTFGLFQKQTLLKLGVISVFAYILFTGGKASETGGSDADMSSISTETTLDVAGGIGETPKKAVKKVKQKPKAKPVKEKNTAAPVAVKDLVSGTAEDYIRRYNNIARIEMEKFGIPASISLAQGLVESRAGTSTLARKNNNHFGIKCFSRNCPGGHCSNHNDDHHKDFFRIFGNPWESWRAHSNMLASGRYAKLKKHGNDYRKWAYGLKSVGYATDGNYAEKLIGIIERYELYKYDR